MLFYGEGVLVAPVSVDPPNVTQLDAAVKLLVVDVGERLVEGIIDYDTDKMMKRRDEKLIISKLHRKFILSLTINSRRNFSSSRAACDGGC